MYIFPENGVSSSHMHSNKKPTKIKHFFQDKLNSFTQQIGANISQIHEIYIYFSKNKKNYH